MSLNSLRVLWVGLAVSLAVPAVALGQQVNDLDLGIDSNHDPRDRGSVFDERPEERKKKDVDPNRDMLFYFPTGKTLARDELAIGFPGQGIPDIQYGLADWMQIGAGFGIVGFTPSIRLGLIRGRRVDATLVYGGFLPVATANAFTGQYAGGAITAGNDEFNVHIGYYWTQFFGEAFPSPPTTREGGFGYTGMDLQVIPRVKILALIATWSEFDKESLTTEPLQLYGVAGGLRFWRGPLSLDGGLMAVVSEGGGPNTTRPPAVLPMFTLRYRL